MSVVMNMVVAVFVWIVAFILTFAVLDAYERRREKNPTGAMGIVAVVVGAVSAVVWFFIVR